MPSFRKPHKQAEKVIRKKLALKTARHAHRHEGKIHSVRTAENYRQALKLAAQWMQANGHMEGLERMSAALADAYLHERAEVVRQKTLDLDRQALQTLPAIGKLFPLRSQLPPTHLTTGGRAYSVIQVRLIAASQAFHNALATCIAHAAGLRAHELLTLQPADQQPASTHRVWSDERFRGRDGQVRYTVKGKGGLVREVILPEHYALLLEETRFSDDVQVTDRGVFYHKRYDIGGGHTWATSFSSASRRALGWSTGAHGLRHSYAQERMDDLQYCGLDYPDALELVSQEMGHFRADITKVYLR